MKMRTIMALSALLGAVQPMAAAAKDKVFALVPKANIGGEDDPL